MKCWNFIRGYRRKHPEEVCHIIMFTDGRSTKGLDKDKDPCEEALEIAKHLHAENVDWIIIDTGLGSSKSDMPERLAEKLGGRFFLLDDLESESKPSKFW
jgi:magnesium chelatase subunit D